MSLEAVQNGRSVYTNVTIEPPKSPNLNIPKDRELILRRSSRGSQNETSLAEKQVRFNRTISRNLFDINNCVILSFRPF